MKNFTCLVLVLSILGMATGCSTPSETIFEPTNTTAAPTETTHLPTQESELPTDDVVQLPLVSVSMPAVQQTTYADDSVKIFSQTYQNMSLVVSDPEIAGTIIIDFLNKTDLSKDLEYLINNAEQEYRSNDHFTPHWKSYTLNPSRIDSNTLSLFGALVTFTGGAHGDYLYSSANYDLTTGKSLSLQDVIVSDDMATRLCQLVLDILGNQDSDHSLFDDYPTLLTQHFGKSPSLINNWYFSGMGLCFYFSPYEIGPFSSGVIIVEIPYADLINILKAEFFPAERELAAGSIFTQPFDADALDLYSQFAEISLASGGIKSLLYTDALVYDIKIEVGTKTSDSSDFIPQYTAFAAYTLTPGDAIVLEMDDEDPNTVLRLTYNANNQNVCNYISYCDGNIQLTEK